MSQFRCQGIPIVLIRGSQLLKCHHVCIDPLEDIPDGIVFRTTHNSLTAFYIKRSHTYLPGQAGRMKTQ